MHQHKTIVHRGRICAITESEVHVSILQASACSSCAAAQLCRSAESKEKVMKVSVSAPENYQVGEEVLLHIAMRQGLLASLYAYVVPLILIVAILFITQTTGTKEVYGAMGCLLILILYYTGLYFCRGILSQKFDIKLIKQ